MTAGPVPSAWWLTTPLAAVGRPAATRRWHRSTTRYMTVTTAPTTYRPLAMIIEVTWMAIQYDCSAGTTAPAGV